jgi:hypothetical protein
VEKSGLAVGEWCILGVVPVPGVPGDETFTSRRPSDDVPIRPCSTEATTRPHKKHRAAHEVPFLRVALAIHAEHDRNGAIIRSTVAQQCRFQRIGEISTELESGDCRAIKSFLAMREKL